MKRKMHFRKRDPSNCKKIGNFEAHASIEVLAKFVFIFLQYSDVLRFGIHGK